MVNEKEIRRLVELFTHDLSYYRSPEYNEAAVRKEFISPFLEALGWDVQNRQSLQPNMREVLVEEGETSGIPDYALRIAGQTKLFIEAKRPAESLDNVKHIMQAKSYAWHSSSVFIVALTDFEEFKLYDATLEPDQHAPERGLIWSLRFDEYSDNLDKLAQLSCDEVEAGSLEKLLLRDKESKHLRTTVDEAFLKLLTNWREELAKSYKKHTPALDTYVLNEVVQRLLDRLVFIRICEDRHILSERSMEELVRYWRLEGKRRDLMRDHLAPFFHRQNRRFNGEILQPHPCEIYPLDSDLLANIVENLYFPESPYRFDWIGVEILGTIYERYLGKTLHVTAKRAKLEEKPEVRKAGGVYYTPAYIVDYIVKNTLGKLLEPADLTPDDVSKLRILDPACGSGSFLLAAYQILLGWHLDYYERQFKEGKVKQTRMIGAEDLPYFTNVDGKLELTAAEKARILQNNIHGVDIDPQAVEITMMSLYIKLLEGEVHFPSHLQILPRLKRNIRCGNSLIGLDFYDRQGTQTDMFDAEETRRINAFDWHSKEHGFGEIMAQGGFDVVIGNPPYHSVKMMDSQSKVYFYDKFRTGDKRFNLFSLFIEKDIQLLRQKGLLGYIIPSSMLANDQYRILRNLLLNEYRLGIIADLGGGVFCGANVETAVIVASKDDSKKRYSINVLYEIEGKLQRFKRLKLDAAAIRKNPNLRITIGEYVDLFKVKTQLLEEIVDIKNGINTGNIAERIITEDGSSPNAKRIVDGKDIDRYAPLAWRNQYILYDPELVERLREKWKRNGIPWTARIIKKVNYFEKPKLIIQRIRNLSLERRLVATFDDKNYYTSINIGVITSKYPQYALLYILGILNSTLMNHYYSRNFRNIQIKNVFLGQLPIRSIDFSKPEDKKMHDRMVELVERMLKLNKELHEKKHSQTAQEALERRIDYTDREIDKLVYELYDLTDDEIAIVEEATSR